MRMFYAGRWQDRDVHLDVRNPFDDTVIDTVPKGDADDANRALAGAGEGAAIMRRTSGYERFQILRRAADQLAARADEFGRLISSEEGKTLAEGRFEASRAAETLELSAEEAKRLGGELLPLDGAPGAAGKLGFTLRVPCGVVAAITPFNFPLNLVCHKVGPALAAGNAVVLKPASDTPLCALRLVELLLEAGLPPQGIACLTGPGGTIGDALVRDPRVRKITFTGSRDVGEQLCRTAGLKRITMELGSNSPLIVLPDADMEKVVEAAVATGYGNAGQVCISTQRLIGVGEAYDAVIERLPPKVAAIAFGNQLDERTQMGPMVREADAERVGQWIDEAVGAGAKLLVGGHRQGALFEPTLLADVKPTMRVSCDELFGPAVAVTRAANVDEAIAMANDSRYGLSAGLFTRSLDAAMKFAREVESGNLHINWGPAWRADLMPYGGLKESGFGKEGPKYAVAEMTETKMVVIHGLS
ncbi:MAG TPA: aldehyde dehydrogenase family protein [Pirellulales bacterium]|jgi:glyceraldehyde-3-phosphate dehydrogenase (NADP+)|nr:aldehyde dehydrogenase family protein [Pirellulales bacterium]